MFREQLSETCKDLWRSLVGRFILQSWVVPGNFHLLGTIFSVFQHWFLICLLIRAETFTVNKLFLNSSGFFVFKQLVLFTHFFSSCNYPVNHFIIPILKANSTLQNFRSKESRAHLWFIFGLLFSGHGEVTLYSGVINMAVIGSWNCLCPFETKWKRKSLCSTGYSLSPLISLRGQKMVKLCYNYNCNFVPLGKVNSFYVKYTLYTEKS